MQSYLILKYADGYKAYLRWAEIYAGGTQILSDVLSDYDNDAEHGKITSYWTTERAEYLDNLKTQNAPTTGEISV